MLQITIEMPSPRHTKRVLHAYPSLATAFHDQIRAQHCIPEGSTLPHTIKSNTLDKLHGCISDSIEARTDMLRRAVTTNDTNQLWWHLSRATANGFRQYFDQCPHSNTFTPPAWHTYQNIGQVRIDQVPVFPPHRHDHASSQMQPCPAQRDMVHLLRQIRRLTNLKHLMVKVGNALSPSESYVVEADRLWNAFKSNLSMQHIDNNDELFAQVGNYSNTLERPTALLILVGKLLSAYENMHTNT